MITLTPVMQKFILHWGEMGTRWGINRTVSQVHALLYVAPRPLNAEEITAALQVARSNVSTSLKELQGWGIVKVVHVLGDRRDHFETLTDVWEMFFVIFDKRRRREIDPTVDVLRDCVEQARAGGRADEDALERLQSMLGFLNTMTAWHDDLEKLPRSLVKKMFKLGGRIGKLLG